MSPEGRLQLLRTRELGQDIKHIKKSITFVSTKVHLNSEPPYVSQDIYKTFRLKKSEYMC